MIEYLNQIDQDWVVFLNNLGSDTWDSFWLFITDKWASIPLYIFLLGLCIYTKKWKKTLLILLCVALLILCTDQLARCFKYGFERLRPCHNDLINSQLRILRCGGKFGFFSAHACSTFAVATFFSFLFKDKYCKLGYFLFFWAVIISYSRIYLAVHYPFDVLVGLIFGCFLGYLFFLLYKKISQKKIFQ